MVLDYSCFQEQPNKDVTAFLEKAFARLQSHSKVRPVRFFLLVHNYQTLRYICSVCSFFQIICSRPMVYDWLYSL